jgi:hypothetical protein
VTPEEYRLKYEIYPGKTRPPIDRPAIRRLVRSLGRVISRGAGSRRNSPRRAQRKKRI